MNVNTVIEYEDGSIKFDGHLSKEETDKVVEIGLGVLLRMGMLSITTADEKDVPN